MSLGLQPLSLAALPSPLLILGAAYSGKSELAHSACLSDLRTLVVGTADLSEGLLKARVDELKKLRPAHWQQADGSEDLGQQLLELPDSTQQVLLDSINQWVANLLLNRLQKYSPDQLSQHAEYLAKGLAAALVESSPKRRIIVVSSEVGAGITPPRPLARAFRQLVSRINCQLAAVCPTVVQVTAGIPLLIKGEVSRR